MSTDENKPTTYNKTENLQSDNLILYLYIDDEGKVIQVKIIEQN